MAKVLVDTQTDEIRGYYEEPLDFSISGRYVLDVPPGLYPTTQVVNTLILRKIAQYQSYHPTVPNYFNDEILATPNINPLNSFRFAAGPNKRVVLFPNNGSPSYVTTNLMTINAPTSRLLIHHYGFLLYSNPGPVVAHPDPSRLLYNYDSGSVSFIDFNPATFQVDMLDNTFSPIYTFVNADTVEIPGAMPVTPFQFCLRFTNLDPNRAWHLSDWLFMYGP